MIEKERLEELIKQGAIIYKLTHNNRIDCRRLRSKMKIVDDSLYFNYKDPHLYSNLKWYYSALYRLFENKEDAEWHREFGCIERTERLEFPTWECMQPKEDEQDVYYNFYNYNHELMGIRVTKQCIALYKSYRCSDLTSTIDIFDNTKENYTLACRKCVELFLGEKK